MMEDITVKNPRQIGTSSGDISNVIFHSKTQSLLIGDNDGHIEQYKKLSGSFTMVKDYRNLGLGIVYSSTQVGRFAIFGGNRNSLVTIDISEQRLCPGHLKSPFEWTYSLQVCEGAGSKVYLSLGGRCPKSHSDVSHFLDVTLLYNDHKKKSAKVPKKMNLLYVLSKKKNNSIDILKVKIKENYKSLQKQANQNKSRINHQLLKTKASRFKSKMTLCIFSTKKCPKT